MSKLKKLAQLPKVAMETNNMMFEKAEPMVDATYDGMFIKPIVWNPLTKVVSKYCIMYPTLVTIGAVAIMKEKI